MGRCLRYIKLLGSKKPCPSISCDNNLVLIVWLEYVPYTPFYPADALAGLG